MLSFNLNQFKYSNLFNLEIFIIETILIVWIKIYYREKNNLFKK